MNGDPVPQPTAGDARLDPIVGAATDYVESWLDGDAGRMASCLHPALAKRAVLDHDSGSLGLDEAPFEDMVGPALEGGPKPYGHDIEISVLDAVDEIASAQVVSAPFVDLLHLARFDDRWLIVNALYERRPAADRSGDLAAVRRALEAHADSWYDRDPERSDGTAHPAVVVRRILDPTGGGSLDLVEHTFEGLLEIVATGPGEPLEPDREVRILAVSGDIASAKVATASWDIHLHLARFGERWLIVNVLCRTRVDPT